MNKITETHTLPAALDRGRPELAGGKRARWSQFSALLNIENNRGLQLFIHAFTVLTAGALIGALLWIAFGPPTLSSLLIITLIALVFVFTLGGGNSQR